MISLTSSLAEEFGPRHIRVNCVSPGPVDGAAISRVYDSVGKELLVKNIPLGRLCSTRDISVAAAGILLNRYMSGANIFLHGAKLF